MQTKMTKSFLAEFYWLHVMNVSSPQSLAEARKMAHDQEYRVLAALGSQDEYDQALARREAAQA